MFLQRGKLFLCKKNVGGKFRSILRQNLIVRRTNNGSQRRTHLANKKQNALGRETSLAATNPTVCEGAERPQAAWSITITTSDSTLEDTACIKMIQIASALIELVSSSCVVSSGQRVLDREQSRVWNIHITTPGSHPVCKKSLSV